MKKRDFLSVSMLAGVALDLRGQQFDSGRVIDVKTFGAIGNGVVDDTQPIQSAISVAAKEKKAVYIPAGTYRITSTLSVLGQNKGKISSYSNTVIFGDGANNSQIVSYAEAEAIWIRGGEFSVQDLTIRSGSPSRNIGLRLGFADGGSPVFQGSVNNLKLLGFQRQLVIDFAWDCSFSRVGCFDGAANGSSLDIVSVPSDNSNNLTFTGCHFERQSTDFLIKSVGGSQSNNNNGYLTFVGCHFETNHFSTGAVFLQNTRHVSFLNCTLYQNDNYGGAEDSRGTLLKLVDAYAVDFYSGSIITVVRKSRASKLIEIVGGSSAVSFNNTYFTDLPNVPAGNDLSGLLSYSSSGIEYLGGVAFSNVRINNFRNLPLSSVPTLVNPSTGKYVERFDSESKQLKLFFDENDRDRSRPVSVVSRYGSMSRGVPAFVKNSAYFDVKIENFLMPAGSCIFAIFAETISSGAGLFFKSGLHITAMAALSDFLISKSPPAGKLGVSVVENNLIRVFNNTGSDQNVSIFVMGAQ